MNIKLMIAAVIGIITSVVVVAVVLIVTKDSNARDYAAIDNPEVRAEAFAPDSNLDPMQPVEPEEADRRATLHGNQSAAAQEERQVAAANSAYVATPVVEDIKSLGDPDDALGRKLFGDLFTPEPAEDEIVIVRHEPEPEPEPRPEPEPVVEVTPPPEPEDPYRDLLLRAGRTLEQLQVAPLGTTPTPTIQQMGEQS